MYGYVVDSYVYALAVSGSTVYAGGWFNSIGGQPRNHIAALNAGTGATTDWNPNANGSVSALAVSGSTVYAGGNFWLQWGYGCLAAFNDTTGAAIDWNPYVTGDDFAIAVSGSTVYVGGTLDIN
ncbi:MAG: hypothetical protein NT106_10555, partial [Candidatus Sumerlaeota bacterium]|nr:hypothetical protein [Candidatus Sumerlaeota bacterium]